MSHLSRALVSAGLGALSIRSPAIAVIAVSSRSHRFRCRADKAYIRLYGASTLSFRVARLSDRRGLMGSSVAATSCRRARRPTVRLLPKAVANSRCASFQPWYAACSRSRPASVNRSSLLRRSARPGLMLISPSRSSGRMFRPSVVRSITMFSANALIVITSCRLRRARMENWVVRRPADARCRS